MSTSVQETVPNAEYPATRRRCSDTRALPGPACQGRSRPRARVGRRAPQAGLVSGAVVHRSSPAVLCHDIYVPIERSAEVIAVEPRTQPVELPSARNHVAVTTDHVVHSWFGCGQPAACSWRSCFAVVPWDSARSTWDTSTSTRRSTMQRRTGFVRSSRSTDASTASLTRSPKIHVRWNSIACSDDGHTTKTMP